MSRLPKLLCLLVTKKPGRFSTIIKVMEKEEGPPSKSPEQGDVKEKGTMETAVDDATQTTGVKDSQVKISGEEGHGVASSENVIEKQGPLSAGDITEKQSSSSAGDTIEKQDSSSVGGTIEKQSSSSEGDTIEKQGSSSVGDTVEKRDSSSVGDTIEKRDSSSVGDIIEKLGSSSAGDTIEKLGSSSAGDTESMPSDDQDSVKDAKSESVAVQETESVPTEAEHEAEKVSIEVNRGDGDAEGDDGNMDAKSVECQSKTEVCKEAGQEEEGSQSAASNPSTESSPCGETDKIQQTDDTKITPEEADAPAHDSGNNEDANSQVTNVKVVSTVENTSHKDDSGNQSYQTNLDANEAKSPEQQCKSDDAEAEVTTDRAGSKSLVKPETVEKSEQVITPESSAVAMGTSDPAEEELLLKETEAAEVSAKPAAELDVDDEKKLLEDADKKDADSISEEGKGSISSETEKPTSSEGKCDTSESIMESESSKGDIKKDTADDVIKDEAISEEVSKDWNKKDETDHGSQADASHGESSTPTVESVSSDTMKDSENNEKEVTGRGETNICTGEKTEGQDTKVADKLIGDNTDPKKDDASKDTETESTPAPEEDAIEKDSMKTDSGVSDAVPGNADQDSEQKDQGKKRKRDEESVESHEPEAQDEPDQKKMKDEEKCLEEEESASNKDCGKTAEPDNDKQNSQTAKESEGTILSEQEEKLEEDLLKDDIAVGIKTPAEEMELDEEALLEGASQEETLGSVVAAQDAGDTDVAENSTKAVSDVGDQGSMEKLADCPEKMDIDASAGGDGKDSKVVSKDEKEDDESALSKDKSAEAVDTGDNTAVSKEESFSGILAVTEKKEDVSKVEEDKLTATISGDTKDQETMTNSKGIGDNDIPTVAQDKDQETAAVSIDKGDKETTAVPMDTDGTEKEDSEKPTFSINKDIKERTTVSADTDSKETTAVSEDTDSKETTAVSADTDSKETTAVSEDTDSKETTAVSEDTDSKETTAVSEDTAGKTTAVSIGKEEQETVSKEQDTTAASKDSVTETALDEDSRDVIDDGSRENTMDTLYGDAQNKDEGKRDEKAEESDHSSRASRKRPGSSNGSAEVEVEQEDVDEAYPPERVYEYQWPAEKGGEFYMLQEQVSEFLGVVSFKRKYPDLTRRPIEMRERIFLSEMGMVTETQCDLGLTPVKSEEVLDLMMRDYPDKYQEYMKVLQERERKSISEQHKGYEQPKIDKSKLAHMMQKAVKAASEYNMHLMRERRDERRAYFDLQTQEVHYPKGKFKVLPAEATKPSNHPVSLIPGQFQDYCKYYTPQQLKYFPVNTALYNPPKSIQNIYADPDDTSELETGSASSSDAMIPLESEDDEDDDTAQADSMDTGETASDSGSSTDSESMPLSKVAKTPLKSKSTPAKGAGSSKKSESKLKRRLSDVRILMSRVEGDSDSAKKEPPSKCHVCKKEKAEELIKCSDCGRVGHPKCLELTEEMRPIIKTYKWQCMECKTCVKCMDPYDEDKMMFCDHCDRGYHTFCVNVKSIPNGRWECPSCRPTETPRKKSRNR